MTSHTLRHLLLAIALIGSFAAPLLGKGGALQAQTPDNARYITGTISDKNTGEALAGVTVSTWQNSKLLSSAFTDLEGKYRLRKPEGAYELRISTIGYQKETIVPTTDNLTIKLENEATTMQEVVVTGFFNKSKESFTGAVQQVSGMELKQISNTNIFTALSALTPGMEMVQNNRMGSNPNQVPELIIRGTTSMSNSSNDVNQPTIILDGTEITMQDLYDLDMNEVESINVLKDASAAALYGSKAANGVIVITRKPIRESSIRVAYNFTGNFQFPYMKDYQVLNAADKLEYERLAGVFTAGHTNSMERELTDKGLIPAGTPVQYALDEVYNELYKRVRRGQNTDWLSQPARTAVSNDHSLRIYGGVSNLRYELNARYGNTEGVMKDDYRRRYGLGFKLDYFINNKLQLSNRTSYSEVSVKNSPYGSFTLYTQMNPYEPIYNERGELNTDLLHEADNPLYEATLGSFDKSGTRSITNTTDIRWDILPEFRVTGHFNITSGTTWGKVYRSPLSGYFKYETLPSKKGSLDLSNGSNVAYNGNIVGSYNKILKDQSLISLTAGWEINHSSSSTERSQAIGFFNDNQSFIGNAAGYPTENTPSGSQAKASDVGAFVTGSYSFRNRYMIESTYRLTGSSVFGENNRWGHFWSAGAGWNLHNENFMKYVNNVDLLKIRASIGYTGKVSFSAYQAMTMYQYTNDYEYRYGIGAVPITIGNPDLSWERTLNYNVGADVSLFGHRLNLVLDAYIRNTQDLLLDRTLPPSTGVTSATSNLGEMQNRGIELQIDGYLLKNANYYWKLGISGYANRNKITKVGQALEEMNRENLENLAIQTRPTDAVVQYVEGESVTALHLVRSAGIDPATGREIYITKDGVLTYLYNNSDRVLIGDTEPKFTSNINTSVYFKGITLYALFSLRAGAWLYNSTRVGKVEAANPRQNADQRVFDSRWKQPGDVALYQDIANTSIPRQTDRFAEKETTLTLNSLNISYEFPEKICSKMRMRNLRLGINLTDILRFSTVKIERGTDYLYSQGFEINLSTTF